MLQRCLSGAAGLVSQSIVFPAGEVHCVTHTGILVMLLEIKYLEAHPNGNSLCTRGNTKDSNFLQELEMKAIFLSRVLSFGAPTMFSPG